jgi:hypothetical protein
MRTIKARWHARGARILVIVGTVDSWLLVEMAAVARVRVQIVVTDQPTTQEVGRSERLLEVMCNQSLGWCSPQAAA